MTKEEYLLALKNCLQSLSSDEQKEALQYYSDYIDEVQDMDLVFSELGKPEDLAKTINEKFATALVQQKKEEENNDNESSASYGDYDALFYSFKKEDVKGLDFSFGVSEVILIPGETFTVETRGVLRSNFLCEVNSNGILVAKNIKKIQAFRFFSHDRLSRIVPRVLITIPKGVSLDSLKFAIGAGRFEAKDVLISVQKGQIEVGAGNCVVHNVSSNAMNLRCGMGRLDLSGTLKGTVNIDCGMGSVSLQLNGNENDYSYDAKVGLGEFKLNNEKKSGVCQAKSDFRKENHFSVNCGMGSVSVSLK